MFFSDGAYRAYVDLLGDWTGRCGVAVWAYCLMSKRSEDPVGAEPPGFAKATPGRACT